LLVDKNANSQRKIKVITAQSEDPSCNFCLHETTNRSEADTDLYFCDDRLRNREIGRGTLLCSFAHGYVDYYVTATTRCRRHRYRR
jgi:hypothetical protein